MGGITPFNMSNSTQPTPDQLRQARHLGAKASLSHLPEQRRSDLLAVHKGLDTRRERNINAFMEQARGGKPA